MAVVRLVCAEEDLDRIREKWNWMLRVGDQHIESSTMKARRRLKLMQPSVEEYNRSIYLFCRQMQSAGSESLEQQLLDDQCIPSTFISYAGLFRLLNKNSPKELIQNLQVAANSVSRLSSL